MRPLFNTFRWGVDTHRIASGLDSGPLVLFDKLGTSLIISPFSQFMAASAEYSNSAVSWGLIGSMKKIPEEFRYSTILYYGVKGIRQVSTCSCTSYFYAFQELLVYHIITNLYIIFNIMASLTVLELISK